ncbi:MAG: hypothetical protein WDZ84_15190 [Rhodovibrionaceae bacterium]
MSVCSVTGTYLRGLLGKVTFWLALNIILLGGLLGIDLSTLSKPNWWEDSASVATNLLTGGLVSFFFYWLVVYLPDKRKRRTIKDNLLKMYLRIKNDILLQVVFASINGGRSDLRADQDTIEELMTIKGFREAFSGGGEAHEGFYAFENQMSSDSPEFRKIILHLERLAKQIEFVLYNYTINDERIFGYFKRLELALLSLRRSNPGYVESDPLCEFIYEIFSGFNLIEGYRDFDVIEKMIADI